MGWIFFFLLTAAANADLIEECMNYTIYPLQYELTITPYISKTASYYHCDITIDVIANTPGIQKIELDAKDLEIRAGSIKVLYENRDIVNGPRPFEYDERNGKLYIYLREPLRRYDAKTNDLFVYKIQMSFTKHVRDDTPGLFLVKYYDEKSKDYTYIYTSRFSPNKAKYAFPCFDNPRFEAGFKFKVYVPSRRHDLQYTNTSLAISEVLMTESTKNYYIIKYMPSPQVALHQVGFHLSQFVSKQLKATHTNDTLYIWAPAYDLHNYNFIHHFGVKIIDMIHEFAQTNRPLLNGPVHLVAVPIQENERRKMEGYEVSSWNLLTNSASRIAYIDKLTSIKQLERMEYELAQQLSRLWLGNPGESQVTRWREEWFKEGLATYMAYYLLTQYNYAGQARSIIPLGYYGIRMKQQAMAQDWHHSTPALNNFNNTLAIEIPARYKELVTMKTGAIWWMLENWLETNQLRASFVKHVNKMRGQYISIWELIAAIDKDTIECTYQYFNGTTPSKILQSWFHQAGYPVVTVNVVRDRTPETIQLKQHHFSFSPGSHSPSSYWLPISYEAQHRENCFNCFRPQFTLDEQTKVYTFRENLNGGWILLNRNSSGYYRVNYDPDTWRLIAASLNKDPTSINEMNRAQIVNDVFALYMSGDVDRLLAEEMLAFLDNERSLVVWDAAIDGFDMLRIEGAHTQMTKTLYWEWEEFMGKRVKRIFSLLIKNTDSSPKTRLFRSHIVSFASEINYEPCLKYLKELYQEYKLGRVIVDPDLRESMFYVHENGSNADMIQTLSSIELEDKATASDRVRQRNRFLIHCPIGEPRPMPIIATEQPVTLVPVTEKLEKPAKPSASSKIELSFVSLLISAVLVITIV